MEWDTNMKIWIGLGHLPLQSANDCEAECLSVRKTDPRSGCGLYHTLTCTYYIVHGFECIDPTVVATKTKVFFCFVARLYSSSERKLIKKATCKPLLSLVQVLGTSIIASTFFIPLLVANTGIFTSVHLDWLFSICYTNTWKRLSIDDFANQLLYCQSL